MLVLALRARGWLGTRSVVDRVEGVERRCRRGGHGKCQLNDEQCLLTKAARYLYLTYLIVRSSTGVPMGRAGTGQHRRTDTVLQKLGSKFWRIQSPPYTAASKPRVTSTDPRALAACTAPLQCQCNLPPPSTPYVQRLSNPPRHRQTASLTMRGFFTGNRHAEPLGAPKSAGPSVPPPSAGKGETIQAVRLRQREKQHQFVLQGLRAEKDCELAKQQGDTAKVRAAEEERRSMTEAANVLSTQVTTLERIMQEVGLTFDLEEEERAAQERLEETREDYEEGLAECEDQIREQMAQGEYISTMASPFMMPSDVYDEDEAMRDVDECAKQTGRA